MSDSTGRIVGRVKAVLIYPVKSMAGHQVERAHLGWHGLDGDRRLALLRDGDASGLPWVSARDAAGLLGYSAGLAGDDPRKGAVLVRDPAGGIRPAEDPTLLDELAEVAGCRVRLVRLWRGTFDAMPLSLLTTASLATIETVAGATSLEVERFRPNLLVETTGEARCPEEKWESKTLVFGDGSDPARIRVNRKDIRCKVVDLNPRTGQKDAEVFSVIVRERRNRLGVYASTERCGTIAVGDVVRVR
jgi:uncharacterized protein